MLEVILLVISIFLVFQLCGATKEKMYADLDGFRQEMALRKALKASGEKEDAGIASKGALKRLGSLIGKIVWELIIAITVSKIILIIAIGAYVNLQADLLDAHRLTEEPTMYEKYELVEDAQVLSNVILLRNGDDDDASTYYAIQYYKGGIRQIQIVSAEYVTVIESDLHTVEIGIHQVIFDDVAERLFGSNSFSRFIFRTFENMVDETVYTYTIFTEQANIDADTVVLTIEEY